MNHICTADLSVLETTHVDGARMYLRRQSVLSFMIIPSWCLWLDGLTLLLSC